MGGAVYFSHTETQLQGCAEAVTSGDLDSDGHPDVVVALDASNTVAVLFGDGAGGLQAPRTLDVPGQPREVVLLDINNDTMLDLLVVQVGSRSLWVLPNAGDGSFSAGTSLGLDVCPSQRLGLVGPEAITVSDLNEDGIADLIITQAQNSLCKRLGILLGEAGGGFADLQSVAMPGVPSAAVAADLNGDTHPDLAITLRDRGELVVLAGNGRGGLASPTHNRSGRTPDSVDAGDFDQDGDIDLVTANREDSTLTVFLNHGDSRMDAGKTLRAGTITDHVVVADLNRDGWVDLVAANGGLDELTVHEGSAEGFRPAVYYPAGHCINDLSLVDLDLDGRTDLLAANCGGQSVSVFHHEGRRLGLSPVTGRRGTIPSEAIRHPGAPRRPRSSPAEDTL